MINIHCKNHFLFLVEKSKTRLNQVPFTREVSSVLCPQYKAKTERQGRAERGKRGELSPAPFLAPGSVV